MLKLIVAQPNGFCAGVERAIQTVELSLEHFGAPVYVRHAIVHNEYVVRSLEERGAIFVRDVSEVPDGAVIITSAHGVSQSVQEEIRSRNLEYIDSTCPLVLKVHTRVKAAEKNNEHIVYIGHRNHPETIGTCGQTKRAIQTVETIKDVAGLKTYDSMIITTQTTLSVSETADIIAAIREKIPHIKLQKNQDICYATENRQNAVKNIAPMVDYLFIFGSLTSSNSNRLVEIARQHGCKNSILCYDHNQVDIGIIGDNKTIGVSAGASCPEYIIKNFIESCKHVYETQLEYFVTTRENVQFRPPLSLLKKSARSVAPQSSKNPPKNLV